MFSNGIYFLYQILIVSFVCIALTEQSQPKHTISRSYPSKKSTNQGSSTRWEKDPSNDDRGQSRDGNLSTTGVRNRRSLKFYISLKECNALNMAK